MKLTQIQEALGDKRLQGAIYSATARLADGRKARVAEMPDEFQALRDRANAIKRHTIDHIDEYLLELERNIESRGGHVVWANTGDEARDFIVELARKRGVNLIVKSKSMTSEEIHLNDALEAAGIETVETDLGEYIIQLSKEKPYHIIAPALHKTIGEVAEILKASPESTAEELTALARTALREKFLKAGIGITGANFLVADSGAVVVVENEGNARLSSSAPRIHIAIAGFEKIIPKATDLGVFLKLLARSATGQKLSVYTSFLAGPRREGEPDGPEEFYLILLDNGRTKVLADRSKRQSLYCIRCGACLNHCRIRGCIRVRSERF
jgi:L-lactate dehydrogenase complex protein LldF